MKFQSIPGSATCTDYNFLQNGLVKVKAFTAKKLPTLKDDLTTIDVLNIADLFWKP
jgi:hypothetical protein